MKLFSIRSTALYFISRRSCTLSIMLSHFSTEYWSDIMDVVILNVYQIVRYSAALIIHKLCVNNLKRVQFISLMNAVKYST